MQQNIRGVLTMDPDVIRQNISDCARDLYGSHYLWGSAGDVPDGGGGALYRRNVVYLAPASVDPRQPRIFAAGCDVAGHYICAGRYLKTQGGRTATASDGDLQYYLQQLAGQDPSAWQPYYDFYSPRYVEGANVLKQIVWGEDCRVRRHFDCIGFINYVMSTTAGRQFSGDINWWVNNTTTIDMDDDVVPGDILARSSTHIAFLGDDGRVLQAEYSKAGVHADEQYDSAKWTYRGRMADAAIQPGQPYP